MTLGCDSLTQPNVKDFRMETSAVLLEGAKQLSIQSVGLKEPTDGDVVVQVSHSGISTGTENLLWSGTCLLYTSPSPRDQRGSRMPSSA